MISGTSHESAIDRNKRVIVAVEASHTEKGVVEDAAGLEILHSWPLPWSTPSNGLCAQPTHSVHVFTAIE